NTTTNKYKNSFAFAAIKTGGTVVSWGNQYNASSKYVPIDTKKIDDVDVTGVQQIYSTDWGAFAALKKDGSVVTWGSANYGGDSTTEKTLAAKLNGDIDVTQIYSNAKAFAAVRADGSVVTWGNTTNFNNALQAASFIDPPQSKDTPLPTIYSTGTAFAELKSNGSVVTWGNAAYGGNTAEATLAAQLNGRVTTTSTDGTVITDDTKDVTQIFSTNTAFAALRKDGSVVTWGDIYSGGNTADATLAAQLKGSVTTTSTDGTVITDDTKNVTQIFSTNTAFAALRADGSVVTWGNVNYGGNSTTNTTLATALNGVADTQDVTHIYSNAQAFAALRKDGSVVTWGDITAGGSTSIVVSGKVIDVQNQLLADVKQIYSTGTAFAALKNDGTVVTWGNQLAGGATTSSSIVAGKIVTVDAQTSFDVNVNPEHKVIEIFSTYNSFAALRADGSVVTWGSAATGGDSTTDKTLAAKLNGTIDVVQIYSTDYAFSALCADGSVVTWGGNARFGYGGDSSTVKDLTGVIGFSDSNNRLLRGTATNDTLIGDIGNDTLIGGLGLDTLTGGLGSDTFKFNNTDESGGIKTRDIITDFNHTEGDKIDLSAIDANSNLADDQTFSFVGSANFTKHAGELHFTKGILEGDTNGDGKADFSIQLNGVTTLVAADFVL
ncbi:MAG: hypothetical protein WCI06_10035, partial [Methylococcaceae bacterium]